MAWESRLEEWSRPPEPSPDASGMLVQLPRAATECEFDLVPEPGQVMQRARTSDAKEHRSTQGGRSMNPLREIDRIAAHVSRPWPGASASRQGRSGSSATSGSEAHMPPAGSTRGKRQNFATAPTKVSPQSSRRFQPSEAFASSMAREQVSSGDVFSMVAMFA